MKGNPFEFAIRRQDRERLRAFREFTLRRFLEDRLLQTAGALAFTSIFAMVPMIAAVLGILAAFPGFAGWREQLMGWVFANFVPAAGETVQGYITEFAANASRATTIGVLVLFLSALSLMMSIEDAFNRIWRVQVRRSTMARFVVYWTALTLGPLLLIATLAVSSYLLALPFIGDAAASLSLEARILGLLPFLIMAAALTAAYTVIPNRRVRFRHALVGALLAAVLFETSKRGFAMYATGYASYERIYGALAMAPIFIFWVYLAWAIVLFGASFTASLSAFEYRPAARRLRPGHEFAGLLRVLGRLVEAHREGRGLHSSALLRAEPLLTDDLLQRCLGDLHRAGLVQRGEDGEWMVVRDLCRVTLLEIYEQGTWRVPLGAHSALEGLPPTLVALMDGLADEVQGRLDRPLAMLFAEAVPSGDVPAPPADQESGSP